MGSFSTFIGNYLGGFKFPKLQGMDVIEILLIAVFVYQFMLLCF